jgi:hypothetical protein
VTALQKICIVVFSEKGQGYDGNDPYYLPYGFDALRIDNVRIGHFKGVVCRMRK